MTTKKGFAPILIIVPIAFVLGIAATFLYFNFKTKPAAQPAQTSVSRTVSPVSSPLASPQQSPDEMASWKTYTSKEAKFFIKYPATFTLQQPVFTLNGSAIYFKLVSDNFKEETHQGCFTSELKNGALITIDVNNFHFSGNKDKLTEYIDFEKNLIKTFNLTLGEEKSLTIDGQGAERFTYLGTVNPAESCNGISRGEIMERVLTVNKEGMPYKIEMRYFSDDKNQKLKLDQILSTFKFLQ